MPTVPRTVSSARSGSKPAAGAIASAPAAMKASSDQPSTQRLSDARRTSQGSSNAVQKPPRLSTVKAMPRAPACSPNTSAR